jgi:HEAT repeat protein
MTDTRASLESLFAAERALRDAEEAFFSSGEGEALAKALGEATKEALAMPPGDERSIRVYRLATLASELPGPEPIEALLSILDEDDLSARAEAGESLLELAYDRFKEVATAIEARLDRKHDGPSMEELPFVLTEVFDPDPVPLVSRFLAHPRADVVAAAIEALATYGDPAAVGKLRPLTRDERTVVVADLDAEATIGELAREAIDALTPEPPPGRGGRPQGGGGGGGAPPGRGGPHSPRRQRPS